jgi:hypothetical protein
MRTIIRTHAGVALTMLLTLGAGACADMETPTSAVDDVEPRHTALPAEANAEVKRDLAALRQVTAPLHNFEKAAPAGWDLQVTGCLEHPSLGGMGFHYVNRDYYLDGEANVEEPEALLHAPRPDGSLRLVAVEYLVPLNASEDAPRLFGREMKADEAQGDWLLHVWVWEHNPAGMFADWNPRVTCDDAV